MASLLPMCNAKMVTWDCSLIKGNCIHVDTETKKDKNFFLEKNTPMNI